MKMAGKSRKRKLPHKGERGYVTPQMAAKMVALAAARDGDNTLLLDLHQMVAGNTAKIETLIQDRAMAATDRQQLSAKMDDLSERLSRVEVIVPTVQKIEPVVWTLERKRIEQVGAKKFIGGVITKARALWLVGGGAVGYVLHALFGWPKLPSS